MPVGTVVCSTTSLRCAGMWVCLCRAVTSGTIAEVVEQGARTVREVSEAKLLTQRANVEVQEGCLRLLGVDAPPSIERALRDARLGPIGGGTDEIMREIIGKTYGL